MPPTYPRAHRVMLTQLMHWVVVALSALALPAQAAELVSDADASTLTFAFTQAGSVNHGKFERFTVRLNEEGDAVAGGALTVAIDTTSLGTDDRERDAILHGANLFNTAQFPTARFVSKSIVSTGENQYRATGKLTIRDQSHELQLPLTARRTVESGTQVIYLTGKTTILRLDYGVGQGEWRSTEWVDDEVSIAWSVRLTADTARERQQ